MRQYALGMLITVGILAMSGLAKCVAESESPGTSQKPIKQVDIVISKHIYRPGEEVMFSITNNSANTIYYTFGCSRPLIYKVEGEDLIALATDILESIPDLTALRAGQTNACRWDQKAWQDPVREGRARFLHYNELVFVPSGQYRFWLNYYLDESEVDLSEKAQTVYSQVLTIR